MSKERLSKLQKWILEYLYETEAKCARNSRIKFDASRDEELFNPETKRATIEVSFSRSSRTLHYKGLIEVTAEDGRNPSGRVYGRKKNFADEGNIKLLFLTDEGEAEAKELLNVKNSELNNKEIRQIRHYKKGGKP